MAIYKYPLLSVLGIEIEYMLVDKDNFNIVPKSDKILTELAKKLSNEFALTDKISISNEFVLHVIEFKNSKPESPNLELITAFQAAINTIIPTLESYNLRLLPTGAHPWMNPKQETYRWPHDNSEIYRVYDDIFKSSGHGFANLQSMHVNLPFSTELEFKFLHNALRLLLPLLPALAASTPILENTKTKYLDTRLVFYENNQKLIPEIAGDIIPDWIASTKDYQDKILEPMYKAIRPYDPEGLLQYEWLNSRGTIPKFEVGAIEIRIIDSQECVSADLAIALFIQAILKTWAFKRLEAEFIYPTKQLKAFYDKALVEGFNTTIDDQEYLYLLDLNLKAPCKLVDLLEKLLEQSSKHLPAEAQKTIELILQNGNLSTRILKSFKKEKTLEIYKELSECLYANKLYRI